MTEHAAEYSDSVFINCPFDSDYKPIFDALIFAIFACRFQPRSALELEDGSQTRIDKLYAIIESCRYGIHDISRTELDAKTDLPRFNMPLELGMFLGCKRFGEEVHKQKRCLILDTQRYRFQKFISDIAGMDIRAHGSRPKKAIIETRDWLANASRRDLPSALLIQGAYTKFRRQLPAIAKRLGFSVGAIPYVDYERMVTAWLVEAEPLRVTRKARRKR